jgi:hypothetical protein
MWLSNWVFQITLYEDVSNCDVQLIFNAFPLLHYFGEGSDHVMIAGKYGFLVFAHDSCVDINVIVPEEYSSEHHVIAWEGDVSRFVVKFQRTTTAASLKVHIFSHVNLCIYE